MPDGMIFEQWLPPLKPRRTILPPNPTPLQTPYTLLGNVQDKPSAGSPFRHPLAPQTVPPVCGAPFFEGGRLRIGCRAAWKRAAWKLAVGPLGNWLVGLSEMIHPGPRRESDFEMAIGPNWLWDLESYQTQKVGRQHYRTSVADHRRHYRTSLRQGQQPDKPKIKPVNYLAALPSCLRL